MRRNLFPTLIDFFDLIGQYDPPGTSSLTDEQIVGDAAEVASGGCWVELREGTADDRQKRFLSQVVCFGRIAPDCP